MKAGVGTSPWAVRSAPARAAPSVAVTVNRSLIDAHVTVVDDEVAAMLEAEVLVVGTNAGIVTQAVEPEELPSLRRGRHIGPLDDRVADALTCARAPDRELVHIRGVGRPLAPIRRVFPLERHGRDEVAVELRDVDLTAIDRGSDLVVRKRERPLLVAALADPGGRLVEQRGHSGHVTCLAPTDVHRSS